MVLGKLSTDFGLFIIFVPSVLVLWVLVSI